MSLRSALHGAKAACTPHGLKNAIDSAGEGDLELGQPHLAGLAATRRQVVPEEFGVGGHLVQELRQAVTGVGEEDAH